MDSQEALRMVNQAVRQLQATADVHERLAEAVRTLAGAVKTEQAAKAAESKKEEA